MIRVSVVGSIVVAGLLAGCVTVPAGPSRPALPGTSKAWDQFQADDNACRQIAAGKGGVPSEAAASAGVGSAVAGTVIGAAIGGLLGGNEGAAVGAGMGLFTGSVVGTGYAQSAAVATQQSYDNVYFQCMYASGNRVPVPAAYAASMRPNVATNPPRGVTPPPNAAIPPRNAPPPNSPPNSPPPNAAIPPPDTPPPYQLPR